MKGAVARHWFLTGLVGILFVGLWQPERLEPLAAALPQELIVAGVLFLMALPLDASTMWRALRRPKAVLLAVAINYVLLPLAAWGVSQALPAELALGLVIVGSIPTTLASCTVLTRRAGGNDPVALLVTMSTNLLCFLVTPFWLAVATGNRLSAEQLRPERLMVQLVLLVVLPIAVAQLLRLARGLGSWATAQKVPLGVAAQLGLLAMIFLGTVQAGLKLRAGGQSIPLFDWGLMIAAVAAVHLAMLWVAMSAARLLRLPREDQIAVGFAGSQKTLMIGLHVALGPPFNSGLAMLPLVAYHVLQLVFDTLVADRLRRQSEA